LVQALAISSQGEAFTVLDADGRVLADAMVSSDSRAAALAGSWPREFGAERLYEKTGHTAHPIFTLFKLLWLRRERPDLWKKAARFLCFEDYLHHRLGIEPAIGWSLAARTMLFNVRERRWDPEILDAVGLRAGQLARPLASGEVAGIVPDSIASNLGLAPGVRVVTGGHDQVCAALGAGALAPGQAALATGTVECVTVAFRDAVFSPILREANLCTYAHAVPGLHATLAYNLTGGNLLRWFRDQWSATEQAEADRTGVDVYELIFKGMAPKPTRLMVLPYFTASGTPHFDAHTPGAILGLRLDTTRGDVLRALLEGLAFELRTNLSLLEQAGISVREIRAVGGGAKNLAWLQLKADVLNRPILRSAVTEAGCLGGALLACAEVTGVEPMQLLASWVPIQDTIEPDPKRAAYYAERANAYAQSYSALRTLARQIF
jgi:xylulokinase